MWKKSKKMKSLLLSVVCVVTILMSGLYVDAANNTQANTIRHQSQYVINYFQNQLPSDVAMYDTGNVISSHYKTMDREFIRDQVFQYLAFDAEGYPIDFDDIIIDQRQLNVINEAINEGLGHFVRHFGRGLKRGDYIEYPLTVTAPSGISVRCNVQLNVGGHEVRVPVGEVIPVAKDVSYDIGNGPLDWDTLKTMADAKMSSVGTSYVWDSDLEPVYKDLENINAAITAGNTGVYPMHLIYGTGSNHQINSFNVTLYKSNLAVEFEPNNGEDRTIYSNIVTNSTITAPPEPVKNGYAFAGWYRDDVTFNNVWDFTNDIIQNNMVLYAKWVPTMYNIKYYNINDTTGYKEIYTIEDETYVLPIPTKEGETFMHWLDVNGNVVTELPKGSTGDKEYTAVWKKNTVTNPPIDESKPPVNKPKPPITTGDATKILPVVSILGISLVGISCLKKRKTKASKA